MKNIIRTCALGVGFAAMFAASALATSFQSERVSIPFQFKVSKMTLPAGEYRLHQEPGNDIAYLVNLKTGQQIQMLRSSGTRLEGRARLVFENTPGGYLLKAIS